MQQSIMDESGANTLVTLSQEIWLLEVSLGCTKRPYVKEWREERDGRGVEGNRGKEQLCTDFCVLASHPKVLLYIYLL